jgi:hypothetical protein
MRRQKSLSRSSGSAHGKKLMKNTKRPTKNATTFRAVVMRQADSSSASYAALCSSALREKLKARMNKVPA